MNMAVQKKPADDKPDVDGVYRVQFLDRARAGATEFCVVNGRMMRRDIDGLFSGRCQYNAETECIDVELGLTPLLAANANALPQSPIGGEGELINFSLPWARLSHSVAIALANGPLVLIVNRTHALPKPAWA